MNGRGETEYCERVSHLEGDTAHTGEGCRLLLGDRPDSYSAVNPGTPAAGVTITPDTPAAGQDTITVPLPASAAENGRLFGCLAVSQP